MKSCNPHLVCRLRLNGTTKENHWGGSEAKWQRHKERSANWSHLIRQDVRSGLHTSFPFHLSFTQYRLDHDTKG